MFDKRKNAMALVGTLLRWASFNVIIQPGGTASCNAPSDNAWAGRMSFHHEHSHISKPSEACKMEYLPCALHVPSLSLASHCFVFGLVTGLAGGC